MACGSFVRQLATVIYWLPKLLLRNQQQLQSEKKVKESWKSIKTKIKRSGK